MAGAGLSVVDYMDPKTPTFFEMVLSDTVSKTLRPAFLHLLSTYARHSQNIGAVGMYLLSYGEEVFFALRSVIDGYYIFFEEATFLEDFYGLKRAGSDSPEWVRELFQDDIFVGPEKPLSSNQLFVCYVDECVLPYVRVKLDTFYESLVEKSYVAINTGASPPIVPKVHWELSIKSFRSVARWLAFYFEKVFFKAYPALSSLAEGSSFVMQILYLFGATKHFTPLSYIFQIIMVRRQTVPNFVGAFIKHEEQYMKTTEILDMPTVPPPKSWAASIRDTILNRETPRLLLMFTVMGLKGLEWWYSDQVQVARDEVSMKSKVIPPPPKMRMPLAMESNKIVVKDASKCPLCTEARVNATSTPAGYVFCYKCIHDYVENHGRCPMTGIQCDIANLRKLFEN
jgi:hypothetical protein